jgi:hypothetical protein
MFVGINEHPPPNEFKPLALNRTGKQARSRHEAAVESFFHASLFSILRDACGDGPYGCISKYFITGSLPSDGRIESESLSPLDYVENISYKPKFFGICGFTRQQVRMVAQSYLDIPDDDSLDRACSQIDDHVNNTVYLDDNTEGEQYRPEQLFRCLSELKTGDSQGIGMNSTDMDW